MIVTNLTRKLLASRRELRAMTNQGYRRHESDWEVHRGFGSILGDVIIDAKVSQCGLYVYTKLGKKSAA